MAETYAAYRLPDLWKSVAGEDPDAGFVHVNTLHRLRVALEQQRDNLRVHRDRLIEGWPPQRSEAADAFVGRLNGLIDAMTATANGAGRICVGVDEAFAAIREVRRQLEQMMAEYTRRPAGAGLVVSNAGDRRLDQQARDAFMAADAKVARASGSINASLPYRGTQEHGGVLVDDQAGAGQPGSATQAVTRRRSSGTTQSAMLPPPVFDPPVPSETWSPEAGPVLTGGAGGQQAGGGGAPTGLAPGPYEVVDGGIVIGPRRSTSTSGPPAVPLGPGVIGPGGVIGAPGPAEPRTAQPGTVPMSGSAARGRAPAPPRRDAVHPGQGPAPAGRPESRAPAGGYRDRSYENYVRRSRSGQAGDADERWAVHEGVPAVLEAPPERPHDPGPGVVGIDR
ncbi:hypothetical protein ACQP2P_08345 [Dactylosporangium sp. CA-139114]|uniref:hypothetical protein n=1 Tax=Dactylosporangium sp. CA-139114 TaxID=3239931 RepID=UPI003D98694B